MPDVSSLITKSLSKIKSLRDHGRVDKYKHQYVGYNYRIDAIQ